MKYQLSKISHPTDFQEPCASGNGKSHETIQSDEDHLEANVLVEARRHTSGPSHERGALLFLNGVNSITTDTMSDTSNAFILRLHDRHVPKELRKPRMNVTT